MRRILCCLLVLTMAICALPVLSCAEGSSSNIEYFNDGSYTITEIHKESLRSSKSVTGNKVNTHYDSDGTAKWKAVLTGSFTYTGSSANCTSSSASVTIYDSAWYTVSKSASKSGNTASAQITMGRKVSGITVAKVSSDMTLSCDANGNLS
ncbi:MAG: hypothetical protein J6B70_00420 [Oscillospiraceae bacterium]|nr:hypothetical protein [Oscillospiraceae bacterium]